MPVPETASEDSDLLEGDDASPSLGPAGLKIEAVGTKSSAQEPKILAAEPNWEFFLVHYPGNWEVESEGLNAPTWLPELQRDWVRPGVNLKRTPKEGQPEYAYDESHLTITRAGGVILPQDIQVAGVDGYVRRVACRDPRTKRRGYLYMDAWEVPKPRPDGQRVKFQRDRAAYNRWRKALVEAGYIALPDPDVIDTKAARVLSHVDRHAAKHDLPAEVREKLVEQAKAKAEMYESAVVPEGDAAATPPRRRAPATKAGKGGKGKASKASAAVRSPSAADGGEA